MENETRIGPKDVFLHLLSIATLYASAIAFNTLVFQYINYWFPEVGQNAYYYKEGLTTAMRFALSALIVVFPVYFFASRSLRKMYEADPGRVNLGIRKWLSYFTMFLAGGIAIGWLIATINKFLEGDFTTAFLLKALTILFTTGSIFFYYRSITKGEEHKSSVRYFAYVVALIVLASVVTAFFLVGSPQNRRSQREDSQRINNLQSIQSYVINYWQAKSKLPSSLADMNDSLRGITIPKDPKNNSDYVYEVRGPETFALCATFATKSSGEEVCKYGYCAVEPSYPGIVGGSGNWDHDAGYQCFERKIDKDFFKNYPAKPL